MPGPKKKSSTKKKLAKKIVKAAYFPKTSNLGMKMAFGDIGSHRETRATRTGIKNTMKRLKNRKSQAAKKNSKGLKK